MGFPSKVRHAVDVEPKVLLRADDAGAITASASGAGVSLDVLDTAYWHNGEIPFQQAAVVVWVKSIDTSTDETYEIQIQVDSDQPFAGGNATVVAQLAVDAPGVYVINLDGPTIKALRDDAKFIRSSAVLDGTTPSLDYAAWIVPAVGNAA